MRSVKKHSRDGDSPTISLTADCYIHIQQASNHHFSLIFKMTIYYCLQFIGRAFLDSSATEVEVGMWGTCVCQLINMLNLLFLKITCTNSNYRVRHTTDKMGNLNGIIDIFVSKSKVLQSHDDLW